MVVLYQDVLVIWVERYVMLMLMYVDVQVVLVQRQKQQKFVV